MSVTTFLFQAASQCGFEPVSYEFLTQAFILYEEEVAVSKSLPPFEGV